MFGVLSSWILSIAGVVSLSVVVELMLPEGSLNKYIRSVFSFLVVLVIISPLPKLVNKQVSFQDFSISQTYDAQQDYINQNNISLAVALQNDISSVIESKGYQKVVVSVSYQKNSPEFKIKAIYVELKNLVITSQAEHKNIVDIKSEILELVTKTANVKKEVVNFVG